MTKLSKSVRRETAADYQHRNIVVTVAPCGSQREALVGFRLKGKRLQYVVTVSDLFRFAAEQYGVREKLAKRAARKNGEPWKTAKRKFIAANSIP